MSTQEKKKKQPDSSTEQPVFEELKKNQQETNDLLKTLVSQFGSFLAATSRSLVQPSNSTGVEKADSQMEIDSIKYEKSSGKKTKLDKMESEESKFEDSRQERNNEKKKNATVSEKKSKKRKADAVDEKSTDERIGTKNQSSKKDVSSQDLVKLYQNQLLKKSFVTDSLKDYPIENGQSFLSIAKLQDFFVHSPFDSKNINPKEIPEATEITRAFNNKIDATKISLLDLLVVNLRNIHFALRTRNSLSNNYKFLDFGSRLELLHKQPDKYSDILISLCSFLVPISFSNRNHRKSLLEVMKKEPVHFLNDVRSAVADRFVLNPVIASIILELVAIDNGTLFNASSSPTLPIEMHDFLISKSTLLMPISHHTKKFDLEFSGNASSIFPFFVRSLPAVPFHFDFSTESGKSKNSVTTDSFVEALLSSIFENKLSVNDYDNHKQTKSGGAWSEEDFLRFPFICSTVLLFIVQLIRDPEIYNPSTNLKTSSNSGVIYPHSKKFTMGSHKTKTNKSLNTFNKKFKRFTPEDKHLITSDEFNVVKEDRYSESKVKKLHEEIFVTDKQQVKNFAEGTFWQTKLNFFPIYNNPKTYCFKTESLITKRLINFEEGTTQITEYLKHFYDENQTRISKLKTGEEESDSDSKDEYTKARVFNEVMGHIQRHAIKTDENQNSLFGIALGRQSVIDSYVSSRIAPDSEVSVERNAESLHKYSVSYWANLGFSSNAYGSSKSKDSKNNIQPVLPVCPDKTNVFNCKVSGITMNSQPKEKKITILS